MIAALVLRIAAQASAQTAAWLFTHDAWASFFLGLAVNFGIAAIRTESSQARPE